MTEEQVRLLCEVLELGRPLGAPMPVAGGFLHRVWRMETERSAYAVKDVSGVHMDVLTLSERIAARARAASVAVPVALQFANSPVVRLGGSGRLAVIVYPWIDGEVLQGGPVTPERAARIGEVLARLHAIEVRPLTGLVATAWSPPTVDLDALLLLARQAERAGRAWPADLRRLLPNVSLWYGRYRQVLPDLYRHQAFGHRDLDQKNVIWDREGTPWVIDWESAGLVNPTVELADVALNWSGVTVGEPDERVFGALVAAYCTADGALADEPRDAIYAVLANWLDWLHYAAGRVVRMQRHLNESQVRPELDPVARRQERMCIEEQRAHFQADVERFDQEVVSTLATIERIATNLDLYASWLSV